ncbi:MAG TPA: hypothetical protein VNX68_16920 [Nitrosopumilaceae archaeon]|jgi:hypothetical protein|nr:hypothetical protein [Nitrosopumilaceae archaeon]
MLIDRPYQIHADAWGSNPLEMFSLEKQRDRLVLSNTLDLKDMVRDTLEGVKDWLPIASETLGISPDIKDYILSPVISMPSDLPNRNQQAFPLTELTRWTTDIGTVMYKTWNGMPIHQEHANKDPTIAKGIILNTIMRPIEGTAGNIWKVIKLAAVDRNRDSVLANDILTRKMNSWSMGAYARDYSCNICGRYLTKGGCEHVVHQKPDFKVFNGKLAYYNVSDPKGFELSSVASPAFYSAKDMNFFLM